MMRQSKQSEDTFSACLPWDILKMILFRCGMSGQLEGHLRCVSKRFLHYMHENRLAPNLKWGCAEYELVDLLAHKWRITWEEKQKWVYWNIAVLYYLTVGARESRPAGRRKCKQCREFYAADNDGLRCSSCARTPIELFENDIDGNFTYSFTANKRKLVTTLMQSLDGDTGRLLDLFFFRGGKVGEEFDYFFDSSYGTKDWYSKTSWVFGDVVIMWDKSVKKKSYSLYPPERTYNVYMKHKTLFCHWVKNNVGTKRLSGCTYQKLLGKVDMLRFSGSQLAALVGWMISPVLLSDLI